MVREEAVDTCHLQEIVPEAKDQLAFGPVLDAAGHTHGRNSRTDNTLLSAPTKTPLEIRENATKNIDKMQKNRKKKHVSNQKWKNLGTTNYMDFDEAGQQRIREQCLAAFRGGEGRDYVSTHSSVTGPGSAALSAGRGRGRGDGPRIFVVDVAVFSANAPLKPLQI